MVCCFSRSLSGQNKIRVQFFSFVAREHTGEDPHVAQV